MDTKDGTSKTIAVLVDGDNAQPKTLKAILEEVTKYGKVTIRRIYGDWTTPQMGSWKDSLNELAFNPVQKFSYTNGKNSTDGALIIDAMDILHSKSVDGFCIVSSDSDFTGLARRIREEGIFVMGIGKTTTPIAFTKSCEIFTFVENLDGLSLLPKEEVGSGEARKENKSSNSQEYPKREKNKKAAKRSVPKEAVDLVIKAFHSIANDSGETHIAELGVAVRRIEPSFDVRTYKFTSFLQLLRNIEAFQVDDNFVGGLNHPIVRSKNTDI